RSPRSPCRWPSWCSRSCRSSSSTRSCRGTLRRGCCSVRSRANVLAAGAAVLAGLVVPGTAAASAGAPSVSYSWKNAQIVAGGFVDGLVFSPAQPGLAYARTDIGGAYRWDRAGRHWVPLMDFTGFNDWNELGVESIAADPGN